MHEQRTQPRHGPGRARREQAPVWVLVLGAVMLGLALMLTAYGPQMLQPVTTHPSGLGPTASGN